MRLGRKQRLKSGLEWDVMCDRNGYCYLVNNPHITKWVKRHLNKRWRKELKKEMQNEYEETKDTQT